MVFIVMFGRREGACNPIELAGQIWGKGLSRGTGRDVPKAEDPGVGNKAISLKNCRNVTLRDFSILHGGHFGILAIGVDNFTIDNLTIDTNRDGIDIDCCRNVGPKRRFRLVGVGLSNFRKADDAPGQPVLFE